MQYFKDRAQAGSELAKKLQRYKDSPSVILAFSFGGVQVGVEMAKQLHLPIGMLALKQISLPWQLAPIIGAVDSFGSFNENKELDEASRTGYTSEYHNFIEEERIRATHEVNMMHASKAIKLENLRGRNVILVDDGIQDKTTISEVLEYLKPARVTRIITAVPIATISVIDFLHISVDEIHCLDVKDNYLDTNHYYDDNTELDYEQALNLLASYDILA